MKLVLLLCTFISFSYAMQNDKAVESYFAAIRAGDIEKVRLYFKGKVPYNVTNQHGETLLWTACCFDKFDIAELLLDELNGAAHCPALNTQAKRTPLSFVCTASTLSPDQRQRMIYKLLDKGADVHYRNGYGETPLWEVVGNPYCTTQGVITILLNRGATLEPNKYGLSPLLVAMQSEKVDQVKELLTSFKLDRESIVQDFESAKEEYERKCIHGVPSDKMNFELIKFLVQRHLEALK